MVDAISFKFMNQTATFEDSELWKIIMKTNFIKTAIALAALAGGLATLPAHATQVSFSGGSVAGNLATVGGVVAGLGDTWETHNGDTLQYSNFGMADQNEVPGQFNLDGYSLGNGTWATSFQLTMNNSQSGNGFNGILLGPRPSGEINNFTVKSVVADPSTWVTWIATYNLLDNVTGLYQQVLFTAPTGTRLNMGEFYSMNVNFDGIMTNDSGWAASFDDRANRTSVPEPGSMALVGLGLVGMLAVYRRKQSK